MIMVGGHLNDQGRKGGERVGGIASVLIASQQNPLWKLMISTVRGKTVGENLQLSVRREQSGCRMTESVSER